MIVMDMILAMLSGQEVSMIMSDAFMKSLILGQITAMQHSRHKQLLQEVMSWQKQIMVLNPFVQPKAARSSKQIQKAAIGIAQSQQQQGKSWCKVAILSLP